MKKEERFSLPVVSFSSRIMYVIRKPLKTKKKLTPISPPSLKKFNTGKAEMGMCSRKTFKKAKNLRASKLSKCLRLLLTGLKINEYY